MRHTRENLYPTYSDLSSHGSERLGIHSSPRETVLGDRTMDVEESSLRAKVRQTALNVSELQFWQE